MGERPHWKRKWQIIFPLDEYLRPHLGHTIPLPVTNAPKKQAGEIKKIHLQVPISFLSLNNCFIGYDNIKL